VPIEGTKNAVAESENIVAETAERIFSDLADAQTINADKKAGWKAPLWQALTEAGLPLSWVAEDCNGSGASLAEGFSVLSAAGRFAIAVPLAETMLAGWLLAQARIASPEGAMTVAPASPKDRITLNADGTLSGRARQWRQGSFDRAGRSDKMPDRGRRQSRRRRQRHRDVQQCCARHAQARAGWF
jgi:acyl-CoA dehydrogenase